MTDRRAGGASQARLVAEALDRALEIDDLRVSIVGPVLHIEGAVSSYDAKRLATRTATALTGVRQVVNHLRVVPYVSYSDTAITEAVVAAFEADPRLASADMSVETREGVVELRGSAQTLAVRCSAECAACSVRGVDHVVNRLEARGHGFVHGKLEHDLEEDLCRCLSLDLNTLRVRLEAGIVYLSGIVPSPQHRQAAESMVRWHSQVIDVVNALAVEETTLTIEQSNIMAREMRAS